MMTYNSRRKERNDEKEIYSMDIDGIYIVFRTGNGYNGKNKLKETSWRVGKWSRWAGGTFLGTSEESARL